MKLDKNSLAGFGKQIDLSNTINGGVTLTSLDISQNEKGYIVTLQNPVFNQENYQIELKPDHLTVYTILDSQLGEEESQAIIPTFIRHLPIPANVDVSKIEAIFEDRNLKIIAPFKSGFSNSTKKIDIRHD